MIVMPSSVACSPAQAAVSRLAHAPISRDPTDTQRRIAPRGSARAVSVGAVLSVDDSAPTVAQRFSELYDRCGVSRCSVIPADEHRVSGAFMARLAAAVGWS